MSKENLSAIALTMFACSAWQAAAAAEKILEFKLVTTGLEVKAIDVKQVEGQSVGLMKMFGVASFKDGTIASKDFTYNWDLNKGNGPFSGYSTYYFEDGSSITARFSGSLQAGKPMHGEYTVLSGSGAYAGAKGTGTFDYVGHVLPDANVFNGKFVLTAP